MRVAPSLVVRASTVLAASDIDTYLLRLEVYQPIHNNTTETTTTPTQQQLPTQQHYTQWLLTIIHRLIIRMQLIHLHYDNYRQVVLIGNLNLYLIAIQTVSFISDLSLRTEVEVGKRPGLNLSFPARCSSPVVMCFMYWFVKSGNSLNLKSTRKLINRPRLLTWFMRWV